MKPICYFMSYMQICKNPKSNHHSSIPKGVASSSGSGFRSCWRNTMWRSWCVERSPALGASRPPLCASPEPFIVVGALCWWPTILCRWSGRWLAREYGYPRAGCEPIALGAAAVRPSDRPASSSTRRYSKCPRRAGFARKSATARAPRSRLALIESRLCVSRRQRCAGFCEHQWSIIN